MNNIKKERSLIGEVFKWYGIILLVHCLETRVIRKYRLYKASKYENYQIVNPSQIAELRNNVETIEYPDFTKKEIVKPYLEKLQEYVNEEDLKIAYKNIATLKIRKVPPTPLLVGGTYTPKKNKISYSKKKYFGHEFLHMASCVYNKAKKITLSGFCQRTKNADIGIGLNEGYTELLNRRLFTELNVKNPTSYQTLVEVTEITEMFFDDKKDMAHLYFTNNLPRLIEHLSKYMPKEKAIDIIVELDKILIAYESTFGITDLKKAYKLKIRLLSLFKNSHPNELEKIELMKEKISNDLYLQFQVLSQELKDALKESIAERKAKVKQKIKSNEHNLS